MYLESCLLKETSHSHRNTSLSLHIRKNNALKERISRTVGRDGEGGRVDDLHATARNGVWLLLGPVVGIATVVRQLASWPSLILSRKVGWCRLPVEDVELLI